MTDIKPTQLIIYQRMLMHYRLPLFNAINSSTDTALTVATCSTGSGIDKTQLEFDCLELKAKKIGPLIHAKGLALAIDNHEVAILPFDIHELVASKCALWQHKPFVLWGHSHGRRKILRPFRRWLDSRCSAIITYTSEGKNKLILEGVDASKIFVANNTVDIANAGFSPEVARRSFLFSGRITKRKGLNEALMAFATIQNQLPKEVNFEIIGEGPERSSLEALATELGIAEKVVFHGAVYDSGQLKQIFQRSLAYVSPGHVGLGVLHSFAYGVPPLTRRFASHAPEFNHIKDGENGLLFDGTVQDLAAVMQQLTIEEKSYSLGRQGYRHYIENCTLDIAINGFESAVNYALSESTK
jgi:glycosyltransferase involved in cell wall biosynthesis